jgi:hypothetical protein
VGIIDILEVGEGHQVPSAENVECGNNVGGPPSAEYQMLRPETRKCEVWEYILDQTNL